MRVIGLLALAAAVVVAAVVCSVAYVRAAKRAAAPTRQLARAVQVLDRVLGFDQHAAVLPTEILRDAQRVVSDYHEEIGP